MSVPVLIFVGKCLRNKKVDKIAIYNYIGYKNYDNYYLDHE